MSIELPVTTRHCRDMTEKLLKATLNPNKQQQQQHLDKYKGVEQKCEHEGSRLNVEQKVNILVIDWTLNTTSTTR